MTTPEIEIVEHEQDVKSTTKRKPFAGGFLGFNSSDTTLNAMVDREGNVLGQMGQDGLVHLLAHAKMTYGIKKGRYYVESLRLDACKTSGAFRFGVSTQSAKFTGGDGSIAFDLECCLTVNGEPQKGVSPQRQLGKGDVVGILVNLEKKHKNENTVSLFVNGQRHSQPVALPENMVNQALFPQLAVKNMSAGLNLTTINMKLPFSVMMMGEATPSDLEKSKVTETKNPKIVFPVGTCPEAFCKEFLSKNASDNYLALTPEYIKEWCADSKYAPRTEDMCGIGGIDNPRLLAPVLRTRNRNVLYAIGNHLFPADREARLLALPGFEKEAYVVPTEKSSHVFPKYQEACFPSTTEGFKTVTFKVDEKEAAKQLDEWKMDQKLRSKVSSLTPGEFFTDRHDGWTKFVTEKKLSEEGKHFTDEDWMLANARVELHDIVHAFKIDVNDPEQPSFPPSLATHYYQTYLKSKSLNPTAFACDDVQTLVKEHLADTLDVDESTGLLKALHDKDVDYEKIWALVDAERDARETRVGAGDELSELKFSTKTPPRAQVHGGKGFKGTKRSAGAPLGMPPSKRREVQI